MALPTQSLFVPLGAGVNRDIDEHLLPVGSSPLVFNGVYNHRGQIVKRFGTNALPMVTTPGGGTLPATWQLTTFKGALVNLDRAPTTTPVAVYSPTATRWSIPGTTGTQALSSGRRGPVGTGLVPVTSDTATNIPGAIAVGSGYIFTAHTTSTSIVRFYAIDATTNKIVYRWKVVGTATQPRIVITPNGFVSLLYYNGAAAIKADVWSLAVIGAGTGAPTTFGVGAPDALGIFDAIAGSGTTVSVAYRQNANQAWRVDLTPATGASASTQITTAAAAAVNPSLAICWISDPFSSGKFAVATAGPVGLQVQWNLTGGTPTTTYVLDPGATANIDHITGHTLSSSATGEVQVLYEFKDPANDSQIKIGQRTIAGGIVAGAWIRSVGLSSQTFANAGNVYVLTNYNEYGTVAGPTIQSTYFLMHVPSDALTNANPTPQARIAVWNGVISSSLSNLPPVAASGSLFVVPVAVSQSVKPVVSTSINLATIQFNPTLGTPVEAADGVLVPGATSTFFDGVNFGPADFDIYPEMTFGPFGAAVGGFLTRSSTYTYQIVFARTDANGRTVRSAPSVPISITLGPGAGTDTFTVTLTFASLRLTNLPVKIEIYRSLANQSAPLQFVASIDNTPATRSQTYVDTTADSTVASGAPIYTTGGVLEHDPTPGFSFVITAGGRAFGLSMDNPTEIWPSNQFVDGEAPSFNEAYIVRIADEHGAITGLGLIDDKVIAIKSDAVYAFAGDGPDTSGRGGYSVPQIIARGVGTANPQSILSIPDGLVFMSTATTRGGLQLVDRSLSLRLNPDGSSFGAPVKDDTDQFTVVAACLIPQLSQARWYLSNKIVCVYDYVRGLWTEFFYTDTSPSTVHAVAWNGVGAFAGSLVTVIYDRSIGSVGTYSDVGNSYFFSVDSPWIQLGGISGYQRLMKIQGVGATGGTHVLTVFVYADFDRTAAVGTYSGTPGTKWDWEMIPRAQRGRAFRISIVDGNSFSAGPQVIGVACKIGVMPGLNRLPASKRLTT